jgi:inner membrane protein involved in colicin E2 resistance
MARQIGPLVIIFFFSAVAWGILGGVMDIRTSNQDSKLKEAVGELWGKPQTQMAPQVSYTIPRKKEILVQKGDKTVTELIDDVVYINSEIDSSNINVNLNLEHRQKGLLWYSTYRVDFDGNYVISNETDQERTFHFTYTFPNAGGIYDGYVMKVNGDSLENLKIAGQTVTKSLLIPSGESKVFTISYKSQGLGEWWYEFGQGVSQIRNLHLTMQTNFKDINFPEKSMSPASKSEQGEGWQLRWDYDNLISGVQIGMEMPQKLNPGPFVSRVSYFAPVSLFFFFFLLFMITMIKNIRVHPMNYFFLAAAFFSFHLLLAYLADHIDINLAMLITSAVSIFLVVSYVRLVVGVRFAIVEVGIAQFVYLVLFSYAFFFEGYTGLAITILSIVTLFIVMQTTGRINWYDKFGSNETRRSEASAPPPPPPAAVLK